MNSSRRYRSWSPNEARHTEPRPKGSRNARPTDPPLANRRDRAAAREPGLRRRGGCDRKCAGRPDWPGRCDPGRGARRTGRDRSVGELAETAQAVATDVGPGALETLAAAATELADSGMVETAQAVATSVEVGERPADIPFPDTLDTSGSFFTNLAAASSQIWAAPSTSNSRSPRSCSTTKTRCQAPVGRSRVISRSARPARSSRIRAPTARRSSPSRRSTTRPRTSSWRSTRSRRRAKPTHAGNGSALCGRSVPRFSFVRCAG